MSKNLYVFLFFWNPLILRVTWQAINFSLQYHPWIKNWRLRELRKGSPTKEALNCETNSSCQPSRTCIENRIVNMYMLVKRSVIVKAREVWVGSGVGVLYPTRPKPFRFFTLPLPSRFVLLTERLEQGRLFSQLYKPLQVSKGLFTRYDFVACDKLTTGLRHELFRVNQTYNSLTTLKSCRRPVVSLSHATKSCRVNRP